ncbi:MAG: DUF1838 family protein [Steroidobacteraceae bacterium]
MSINVRQICSTSVAAIASAAACSPALALDLTKPVDAQQALVRMMGDIDGKPVFKDWDATIFAVVPGQKPRPILRMQGFNAGRMIARQDGSYEFASREVSYYQDLQSGEIIESWSNPLNGKKVCLLHVANDPVNNEFPAPGKGPAPAFNVAGNVTSLRLDIPLAYPNPLQPAQFPEESSGPTYLASEHFIYFSDTAELTSGKLPSTPTHYSWFRTGPWLPWMKMGKTPGYLLYSGQGRKYATFDELPEKIKVYTREHYPSYVTAPDRYVQPNETSWTYYAKVKTAGKLPTACK